MNRVDLHFPVGSLDGGDEGNTRLVVFHAWLPRVPVVGDWVELGEDSYLVKAVCFPLEAPDADPLDQVVCVTPYVVMGRW